MIRRASLAATAALAAALGLLPAAAAPAAAAGRVLATLEAGRDQIIIVLALGEASDVTWEAGERELLLRFDGAVEVPGLDQLGPRAPEWLEYASAGFDTMLLRFARPVEAEVAADGRAVVIVARAATAAPPAGRDDEVRRAGALRDALLRARLLVEEGRVLEGRRLLRQLARDYPDSAETLAYLGVVEQSLDRRRHALWWFDQSLAVNADDPGVRAARRTLQDEFRPRAWVDVDRAQVQNADEQIIALTGFDNLPVGDVLLSGTLETRSIDTPSVLRPDGTLAPYSADRQRLRLTAALPLDPEWEASATLHLTTDGAGLTGTLTRLGPVDELTVLASLQEPFWGFVEGIVGGGVRDSLGMQYRLDLAPDTDLLVGLAGNLYGTDGNAWSGGTLAARAVLGHTVPLDPATSLRLEYGIDGEYVGFRDTRDDPNGVAFQPIPVTTRETHSAVATVTHIPAAGLALSGYVGYGHNRYGTGGLLYGLRLEAAPHDDLRIELRAGHAETTSRGTGGALDTVGGRLTLLF
ncbi:tetratricopeptide repeat protein [Caenispirillum bisanense]|uniref:Tetratricopeptide repeat-containing protein n=1 Tax=Caenispirillum bisanense TaxID=414052 RepID=A0A286GSX8_9PROT|nr:hypothetical protein [Caenispirillum bisanense]SOD98677.1 hypothetical protein SAMN05421508_10848 [Caenispirillum bisanense]